MIERHAALGRISAAVLCLGASAWLHAWAPLVQHAHQTESDPSCAKLAQQHGDDAHDAGMTEHVTVLCNLVPSRAASHVARASGPWSSTATWGGALPGADATVLVPSGMTVVVDRELDAPLSWVRIDGVLRFATRTNTALRAETVVVAPDGKLEMGTASEPVVAAATAQLIIHPKAGPIDHTWDPLELSRGLIALGRVEMHGSEDTPFVPVSVMPAPGDTTLRTDVEPVGWAPGDQVVLTATEYDQDESFTLVSQTGTVFTLDHPIKYSRSLPVAPDGRPYEGLALHLANVTRNVQVRTVPSAAGDRRLQGHVMLMHGGHRIAWAGFYDLGRTTIAPVTDPAVEHGVRDPGISPASGIPEENVRGRYGLHFHRGGPAETPSSVEGCAVTVRRAAGFKIGLANHSSNVAVRGCVSHNIDGSHFFTEEGDELGEFRGNLAIHSVGSGKENDEQPRDLQVRRNDPALYHKRRLDVGHRGTGFWLNGGGVAVVDNVSAGQAHAGFHVWTRPLSFRMDNTYAVSFPKAHLTDSSWAGGKRTTVGIAEVPLTFTGNVAYVSGDGKSRGVAGFLFDYHSKDLKKKAPNAPYSKLHDLLSWNTGGLETSYTGNLHLKNVRVIGMARPKDTGIALNRQGGNHDLIENVTVEGFEYGIDVPYRSVVRGGSFRTAVGLLVRHEHESVLDLSGMAFAKWPVPPRSTTTERRDVASSSARYDIYLTPILREVSGATLARAFDPEPVLVEGHPSLGKQAQLYSVEQMPDYILPDFGIPGLLDGQTTTRQAWETHRLAPGGAVAPAGAANDASVQTNGRFAPRAAYDVPLHYPVVVDAGKYTPKAEVRPPTGRRQNIQGSPIDLRPGWNLVPMEVAGVRRTLLIHAGPLPKAPTVDAGPDQLVRLDAGARVSGSVGEGASLRWSRAYGPGEVVFEEAAAADTHVRFPAPGVYVLHLSATSAAGHKNTASVTITVRSSESD